MVIVIPLADTQSLINIAQSQGLQIPIPLSSACESYLAPEEMGQILELLTPLAATHTEAETLLTTLTHYADNPKAVMPCTEKPDPSTSSGRAPDF
ncbi:MAG: hypothetical protein AAFW84_31605 [Cyanobacteria bacterium J06635_15]